MVAKKFEKFDPEEAFALMDGVECAGILHPADGAAHAALGAAAEASLAPAALGRLRR